MPAALPIDRLDALVDRHAVAEAELAAGPEARAMVALSREIAELEPVVEAVKAWRAATASLAEARAIMADAGADAEFRALAAEEAREAADAVERHERALMLALLPKDAADARGRSWR